MSDPIKILIENYDNKKKEYVLGKQVICEVSIDELMQILTDLPFTNNSFTPRVITSYYIFHKKRQMSEEISYKYNKRSTFVRRDIGRSVSIERVGRLMRSLKGTFSYKTFSYYMELFYAIVFLISHLMLMIQYFTEYVNIIYFITSIWALSLSLFYVIYSINQVRSQNIQINYTYPFKNYFKPEDITGTILFFLNYELIPILLLLHPRLLENLGIVLSIGFFILLLIFPFFQIHILFRLYRKKKKKKETLLQDLYHLLESLEQEQKLLLYQFAAKAEEQKTITVKLLYEFLGFFSLILSLIPLFSLI